MIKLAKPYIDEAEIEELKSVFDSGWLAGQGPKNKELEQEFSKYVGSKNAVCVNNCTAGLHLALLALGIGKGDEVIVTDYSFPATAHSVLYVGAKPVFVDIDPKTHNMDVNQVEEKITDKTKAILPVHAYGQCVDMDPLLSIAKIRGLKIIEDCACAVGATYKGRFAGSMGDIGCFSFHARKNITSGEGGINVADDLDLADDMRSLSSFGITSALSREKTFTVPEFVKLGYNYKLSDVAAAIALVQLRRSNDYIKKRNELAKYYAEKLECLDVQVPYVEPHNRHVFQTYAITVEDSVDRNVLIHKLKERGVQSQIGTYALHRQPVYKSITDCEDSSFPVASKVFDKSIALPMFHELTFEQIDDVCKILKELLK